MTIWDHLFIGFLCSIVAGVAAVIPLNGRRPTLAESSFVYCTCIAVLAVCVYLADGIPACAATFGGSLGLPIGAYYLMRD